MAMFLADCTVQKCEWDHLCQTEDFGRFLEVLHVVLRHPEEYRATTGKDPDQAKADYREQLEAYGHLT